MQTHALWSKNPHYEYAMKGSKLSVTSNEKDLGVEVADNLAVTNQCAATTNKANGMLGMVKRTIINRKPDIMLRLYMYNTLVRQHLDYCTNT